MATLNTKYVIQNVQLLVFLLHRKKKSHTYAYLKSLLAEINRMKEDTTTTTPTISNTFIGSIPCTGNELLLALPPSLLL